MCGFSIAKQKRRLEFMRKTRHRFESKRVGPSYGPLSQELGADLTCVSTAARLGTEAYVSKGIVFEFDAKHPNKFPARTPALAESKTSSVAIGVDGDLW